MSRTSVAIVLLALPHQVDRTLRCLDILSRLDPHPEHRLVLWIQGDDEGSGLEESGIEETSTLETMVRDRFPEIGTIRHRRNLGVAGGRNAAVRHLLDGASKPPSHLFFLDNDMTVEPDLLGQLLAVVDEPSVGLATGKILELDNPHRLYGAGGCRIRFWRGETGHVGCGELDRGQFDDERVDILPSGGCFLVRAEVFDALDGFDEIFSPYGPEDLDFGLRARAAGWRARYAPTAIAYHPAEPGRSFAGGQSDATYVANRVRQWLRFLHRHGSALDRLGFYAIGGPWLGLGMVRRALRRGHLVATISGLLRSVGRS